MQAFVYAIVYVLHALKIKIKLFYKACEFSNKADKRINFKFKNLSLLYNLEACTQPKICSTSFLIVDIAYSFVMAHATHVIRQYR